VIADGNHWPKIPRDRGMEIRSAGAGA
jgi:hypothetical protein